MRLSAKGFMLFFGLFFLIPAAFASEKEHGVSREKVSAETETCIGCHSRYTPGIVEDWLASRHARTIPEKAMKKSPPGRRISAGTLSEELSGQAVGCYECHSLNPGKHKDSFDHMGFRINVVVSPEDCGTCHPVEAKQFSGSKKAHAVKNLIDNAVYHSLVSAVTGVKRVGGGGVLSEEPSADTLRETCLGCHGTRVEVRGMKKVSTAVGQIEVPDLTNWPNQGVGRENPDGSIGSCSACHPRHHFSIEVARKPYTCGQCHLEPDVPAWNVYKESKHGNIYFSKYREWDFDAVPWVLGKDFTAPTCATCHNSLVVSPDGDIIAERTHDFGSRLWVRLFGLIYSHPQPKSGNMTIIRNGDGMPLPVTFKGDLAAEFLIDDTEQDKRLGAMKALCNNCHSSSWIDGHFSKLRSTQKETDRMVLAATDLITGAWEKGIEDRTNPFDESIEQMWVRQWLFYANSVRYASAMTGAPDYATFKNGWWSLSENLQHMKDWIELKEKARGRVFDQDKR